MITVLCFSNFFGERYEERDGGSCGGDDDSGRASFLLRLLLSAFSHFVPTFAPSLFCFSSWITDESVFSASSLKLFVVFLFQFSSLKKTKKRRSLPLSRKNQRYFLYEGSYALFLRCAPKSGGLGSSVATPSS